MFRIAFLNVGFWYCEESFNSPTATCWQLWRIPTEISVRKEAKQSRYCTAAEAGDSTKWRELADEMWVEAGGWGHEWVTQWDSPLTELPSPLGEEERESPFSVFSELEPFWLWWSAVDAALDDVAEVDVGLAFSLKSVMMTVRSPTVTSRCWALLRSMFFNLGLVRECKWLGKVRKKAF